MFSSVLESACFCTLRVEGVQTFFGRDHVADGFQGNGLVVVLCGRCLLVSSLASSPDLGRVGQKMFCFLVISSFYYLLPTPPEVLPVGHQAPTGHRVNGITIRIAISIAIATGPRVWCINLPQVTG